jgi:hypothetical protein
MSSDRRKKSSRANGALSNGPSSPEGKKRSSRNALQHGFLASCVLLNHESKEHFEILMQNHVRRFQPAEGVEFGIIEEMCSAYWRLHRLWAMEKFTLEDQMKRETDATPWLKMGSAFNTLAAQPGMALMQRYETRLQNMYSRAIRTFKVLRTIELPDLDDDIPGQDHPPNIELPKEPSPISEHPSPARPDAPAAASTSLQPTDPEALGSACFSLRGSAVAAASIDANIPVAPPPKVKKSGGAV